MKATTFLMFAGQAEEAMNFYAGLLPGSRIESIERFGAGEAGKEGTVKQAVITIAGTPYRCFDSPVRHAFTFTPAISIFVDVDSLEDLERLVASFSEGGSFLMPPDNYGFSQRFAWVQDRFGVSWQLNLP